MPQDGRTDASLVFDLSSSLGRLGNDKTLFRTMVRMFLEDCPGLLGKLTAGLEGDPAAVELAAHSLKGLAASFSCASAIEAAARVEELGRTREMEGARAAAPRLEAEVARLQDALARTIENWDRGVEFAQKEEV